VKLSVFYLLNYGGLGGVFPFMPLLFSSRGLSPTEIARVMLLIPISGVLVPPLWGMLADAYQARIGLLRIATIACAFAVPLLGLDLGALGTMAALGVFCFFRVAVAPLADAASFAALAEGRRFGMIRSWGSVGFAICALAGGRAGVGQPFIMLGLASVLYVASVIPTYGLSAPSPEKKREVLGRTLDLLRGSALPILLLGNGLHYVGQSIFDIYFSLHMKALGHGESFVGLGWAIAVISEVGAMFFGPRLLATFDARRLLAVCGAAAMLRWMILSLARDDVAILAAQTLHGLSFGLWYLAMVDFVQNETPDDLRATVQAVAATSTSLGTMLGYTLGGAVFEVSGGGLTFQVAAAAAACATASYGFLAVRPLRRLTP
jgi:PPP family 3-phenylpropionic acid transporter